MHVLNSLRTFANDFDFDEPGGGFVLEAAAWTDYNVDLTLAAISGGSAKARWRVRCEQVRALNLDNSFVSRLELLDDHVLLWPHVLPQVTLFYRGCPRNRLAAVGGIAEAHRSLVSDWFHWERFLNKLLPSMKYLDGSFGIFADGPDRLINAYEGVLREQGLATSRLEPRQPKWWNGSSWVDESCKLFLLLLGDSYVISPNYTETRL